MSAFSGLLYTVTLVSMTIHFSSSNLPTWISSKACSSRLWDSTVLLLCHLVYIAALQQVHIVKPVMPRLANLIAATRKKVKGKCCTL